MRVALRVTPKARQARIDGVETGADEKSYVKVRVTAPPEKGKANDAVIKLLAKEWGLARRHIAVVSGDTARTKTLELAGDATSLLRDLEQWLKQQKTGAM